MLPSIMEAFVEEGCETKLTEGWKVSERARSFQLVWLHWKAMWRSRSCGPDIDTEEAFRQLVRFLTKVPSHKVRRAGGGSEPYDVLIQ